MSEFVKYPLLVLVGSLLLQCLAAYIGDTIGRRTAQTHGFDRKDFGTVLTSSLTLLGLLIGFSLTMAVGRYDERKTLEEAEANAIGTQYLRASLVSNAGQMRTQLSQYADARVAFYLTRDEVELQKLDAKTTGLQNQLWTSAAASAPQANPIVALSLSGMNDVINSAGYTQAAWLNRIPTGVWILMLSVATACNVLLGYGEEHKRRWPLLILPVIVSTSLFLIADVDSPRHGLIRVQPVNIIAVANSIRPGAPGH
jgi:hypothetical protein